MYGLWVAAVAVQFGFVPRGWWAAGVGLYRGAVAGGWIGLRVFLAAGVPEQPGLISSGVHVCVCIHVYPQT